MIKKLQNIYHLVRLLSIDIVLGALAGGIYATRVLDVFLPLFFWILLPSTVWVIYLADHLTDGLNAVFKPVSEKYHFYLIHAKTILYILSALILFNAVLFIRYPGNDLRLFGIIASSLVLIYFIVHRISGKFKRYIMQKEVLIALAYTFGIFGAPLWVSKKTESGQLLILAGYMTMVLANVLICSLYDYEADKVMNQDSMATKNGIRVTRLITAVVLTCSYVITFLMMVNFHYYLYATLHFVISSVFLLLLLIPSGPAGNQWHGIIADAAFFLPALSLFRF